MTIDMTVKIFLTYNIEDLEFEINDFLINLNADFSVKINYSTFTDGNGATLYSALLELRQ